MIVVGRLLSWSQHGNRFRLAITGHPGAVMWRLEVGGIRGDEAHAILDDCVGRVLAWTVNDGELIGIAAPKVKAQ